MNNPSPFETQASALEQKNKSRARVRVFVSCILAVHFLGLMGLLMIGCRKPAETEVPAGETNNTAAPTFDTNAPAFVDTNAPATNATVYVPPTPEPIPVVVPASQEYVIVKGDTFEKIAKAHGVTTKAIQDANPGVDSKKLKINQKINIPAAAATASVSSPTASVPAVAETSGEQIYKVKSGDSLTTIAKHFGVTVKALRSANSLTTDKIKVGDKLKVPVKIAAPVVAPVETPTYTPAPTPATTTPKSL